MNVGVHILFSSTSEKTVVSVHFLPADFIHLYPFYHGPTVLAVHGDL